jgi:quinol monooxygenase YgiN
MKSRPGGNGWWIYIGGQHGDIGELVAMYYRLPLIYRPVSFGRDTPSRVAALPNPASLLFKGSDIQVHWTGEVEMAIKVIVELQAKPGKRAEVKSLLESVEAKLGPGAPGYLGSTRYEVLDNPNILVEIAEWESAEVRASAMQEAMASGAYAPLGELLAAPFRATVISQLP